MRVLVALTYYRPHISGLTIYAERLATALAARGHEVTVLTSRYDRGLPGDALLDGVRVVRVPVALRVGKGVVMPSHGRIADRLLRDHDVVSIHVPQLEAASLAWRARRLGRPSLLTYHCDLRLPPGPLNRAADRVVAGVHVAAAALATRLIAYTDDYAASVGVLRRFRDKVAVVPPPVVMPPAAPGAVDAFRRRHDLLGADGTVPPTIGMAARLATEKGVEVLVAALPRLRRQFPELQVLFAGPHENVAGEESYRDRLAPRLAALGSSWRFLGPLDPVAEMPAFLSALDCLVVPSINSTESFGLVQVEAMLSGTPVVASGLPGVREPVRTTGMGEVVAPRDPAALAEAVAAVLASPERYRRSREEIARRYDLDATVDRYEELFAEALQRTGRSGRAAQARA